MGDIEPAPRRIYEFRQEGSEAMTDEQRAVFTPTAQDGEPFVGPPTEAEAWLHENIDSSTIADTE